MFQKHPSTYSETRNNLSTASLTVSHENSVLGSLSPQITGTKRCGIWSFFLLAHNLLHGTICQKRFHSHFRMEFFCTNRLTFTSFPFFAQLLLATHSSFSLIAIFVISDTIIIVSSNDQMLAKVFIRGKGLCRNRTNLWENEIQTLAMTTHQPLGLYVIQRNLWFRQRECLKKGILEKLPFTYMCSQGSNVTHKLQINY